MGSARYSASGAEAFLDKLVDGGGAEVQADGPGTEGEAPGRVDPPRRPAPEEPAERPEAPRLPEPEPEEEAPEAVSQARREPSDDEEVEIEYRGKPVRVTKTKLRELAQKGFSYESKMTELKRHEESLQADKKGWDAYQEYRQWMRENVPAAKAVANLLEFFETKGKVPRMDLEGEGEEGTEKMPASIAKALDRVNQRFDDLDKRERQLQIDRLAQAMLHAVRSSPVLKRLSDADRKANRPDRALKKLATAMKADPDAELDELAEQVATEIQADVETLNPATRTYVDEKTKDQKRFGRPERAGAAAPELPVPEAKEYTGKDLKDGTVRRGVKAYLESLQ